MPRLRNAAGVVVNVGDDTAARLGSGWVPVEDASTGPSGYQDTTVAELKDEIRTRNEGRDDDTLPLTGSKSELIAVLQADD